MRIQLFHFLMPAWKPAAVTVSPSTRGTQGTQPPHRLGEQVLFASTSGGSGSDGKRTVRARRRRRGTSSDEERQRADEPQRDSQPPPQYQAPPPPPSPPSGGGGTGWSAGPVMPGGTGRSPLLMIGLLAVLAVCALIYIFMGGGGEDPGDGGQMIPALEGQAAIPMATARPDPVVSATATPVREIVPGQPSTSSSGDTWLVMLYQDADDQILEEDIFVDLNEAERVGSSENVHIVAQMDRFRGGFRGDGDWTSTKRFYITRDDDLNRIRSQQVADLGEVNMADGQTLVDFVAWAVETYPADKYALILSDHGLGWPGGWSDPTSNRGGDRNIPLTSALGDQLFLHELDEALAEVRSRTGIDKFELIGLDACLMSHLEVYSALTPHARYAVASQETEPSLGWAYTSFLSGLQANPGMDGAELSRLIVNSYIDEDQRIVDDQARLDFVSRGSPLGAFGLFGAPSAQQLARQLERNVTLTAVDLAGIPALGDSFNQLLHTLQGIDQRAVAQARSYAQSFTSIFGDSVPPSYLDLGNLSQLLARITGSGPVADDANRVLAALDQVVLAERHGDGKPGATGISVYFPNSQLYANPAAGVQSYTAVAGRFAGESLWDDFLAYHYTGRGFDPADRAIAVPETPEAIRAPASGGIQLSPIKASSSVAAPGEPALLSIDISGDNVGYVKLIAGYYDPASNAIAILDSDYLESPETQEIGGVYYPDWGEGDFTLEFEWEPLVFAIDDGSNTVPALFSPQEYGKEYQDAVYTVDGIYTYAEDGESLHARLYFRDGTLFQVYGFTGENGTGAPWQIVPKAGDRFTVLERWMDLDQEGQITQMTTQPGDSVTFGGEPLSWVDLDAPAGEYVVGFVVEDLDGNAYPAYTQLTVQ